MEPMTDLAILALQWKLCADGRDESTTSRPGDERLMVGIDHARAGEVFDG